MPGSLEINIIADIEEIGAAFKLLGLKLKQSEIQDLMQEVNAQNGEEERL